MKQRKKILITLPILAVLMLFYSGCGVTGGTARVTINLGFGQDHTGSGRSIIDRVLRIFESGAYALPPSGVNRINITITGTGMKPMNRSYGISSDTITVMVPAGLSRVFTVEGVDALGKILYSGSAGPVDCVGGESLDISVTMEKGSITISAAGTYVMIGQTQQYTATASYADSTSGDITSLVTWVSSDTGVVTIDTSGLATGVAKGTAGISASYSGISSNSAGLDVHSWGKIYVANRADNTVSVIDGQTGGVVTTINVGNGPGGVGANRVTGKVYVSNSAGGDVSVISSSTDTVIGSPITTLITDTNPFSIAVDTVTNRIFVTQFYAGGTMTLIDGSNDSLISASVTACASYSFGVGINENSSKAYVSCWNPPEIISSSDGSPVGTVTLGSWGESRGVAVNPVTGMIYVADFSNDDVKVIDGSTDAVIATVSAGAGCGPYGIGVNSITNKIYIACYSLDNVVVMDGSGNTLLSGTAYPISTQVTPMGITVNPYSNRIYAANSGSASVTIINGTDDSVVNNVTVGNSPYLLDIIY